MEIVRLVERVSDCEYEWYTSAPPEQTDIEILEEFFGELDLEVGQYGKYLTKDWCSAVSVSSRQAMTEDELTTLRKFMII